MIHPTTEIPSDYISHISIPAGSKSKVFTKNGLVSVPRGEEFRHQRLLDRHNNSVTCVDLLRSLSR